jgi:AraC-like DNA-binding protein
LSNLSSPRTPARYFALLCDLLKARGVDVESMLRAAKIWPTQIYGPDATLTLRQLEALLAQMRAVVKRGDIAFDLGRQIKLSSHEILGYGILTSATLDNAMQLCARYYRLITPTFKLQYRRDRSKCELQFQPTLQFSPEALRFLLEVIVVSTHEQLNSLMQARLPAYDILVSYPEPAHGRAYRDLKPARFHFLAEQLPGVRFVLESEVAAQKLPMADRAAREMAESRCEQLLRKTAQASGLTGWVTMMLREAHEGMPTLAELAHLLNQSPRTLDRHLGREGSRFLAISKRVRHEKACELLKASEQSITQVAYQLGYKDGANFTRAFRRESGLSPSDYRGSSGSRR